ncbi:MAG: glycosyltransferase family 4 protein [Burkholderiales bacterium]|nr:glycosyltransferase family 4 protein [Burkholderiales bacterium]
MKPKSVLFVFKGLEAASTRYRARVYYPYLRARGWAVSECVAGANPLARLTLLAQAARADVVVVLRKTFSAPYAWLLRAAARRLVFDFDDAIFVRSSGAPSRLRMRRFARMAARCDHVFAGNAYLAEHARAFNPRVTVVPTSIEPRKYAVDAARPAQTLDLVWIGSASTRKYLVRMLDALERAAARVPQLRLKIVADFGLESSRLPIVPVGWSERTEAAALASAHIGIAPLPDNDWTRGKCALKVLQYMAAGLPVVASPVGANLEAVEAGVTGLLADTPDEWVASIVRLAAEPALRAAMGAAGRARVAERYAEDRTFACMHAVLESLSAQLR